MRHRGIMLDLARERSFHLRWTVELLSDLPRQGSNELHLYLENRFAFPSLRGAYPRGSLTPRQAKSLEREARRLGVRIIPHLNLLGHNENLLRRPRFRKLRAEQDPADAYQLNPLHPGVRPLLAKMIRDICRSFSSCLIHIGCDEAVEWNGLEKKSGRKAWRIFADHVQWVRDELRKHGRRAAIWADMAIAEPRLLAALPRDIVLFDWCYSGGRPGPLRKFVQAGFEVIAATSPVGCFSFLPSTKSVGHQLAFLRDARIHGALGHVATLWELMRGYLFSIEYAFSLPVQWRTAGHSADSDALWKRRYGRAGHAWWRAALQLAGLQWDHSMFRRPLGREDVLNTDASQALTFPGNPFAFVLKYDGRFHHSRIRKRLDRVEAWLKAARRLPVFRPKGPLRFFADDLVLTARRMEITCQHALDWHSLAAPFAAGYPAVLRTVLGTWKKEYAYLLAEYRRRVRREGYGRPTLQRLAEATRVLGKVEAELVRACGKQRPRTDLAAFIDARVSGALENYSLRRSVHPLDLA